MKVLIFGGDGMLGHQLYSSLTPKHDVYVTLRQTKENYSHLPYYTEENARFGLEVSHLDEVNALINELRPEVIVNAIGIVKQRKSSYDVISSLEINSLFPHKLAEMAKLVGARVIHMSTDCVFDGNKGTCYTEEDKFSATDLYGMSKYLGELHATNCLTLRTSIIGLEISRKTSLVEWFLAQTGTIKGFEKAIFSGFTTKELCRVIERMMLDFPEAHGLYHVSMDPINKFDLLNIYKNYLGRDIEIKKETEFVCHRGLNSDKFRQEFNYQPPSWEETLKELAQDTIEKYEK